MHYVQYICAHPILRNQHFSKVELPWSHLLLKCCLRGAWYFPRRVVRRCCWPLPDEAAFECAPVIVSVLEATSNKKKLTKCERNRNYKGQLHFASKDNTIHAPNKATLPGCTWKRFEHHNSTCRPFYDQNNVCLQTIDGAPSSAQQTDIVWARTKFK